jgi:hypothetical protein
LTGSSVKKRSGLNKTASTATPTASSSTAGIKTRRSRTRRECRRARRNTASVERSVAVKPWAFASVE